MPPEVEELAATLSAGGRQVTESARAVVVAESALTGYVATVAELLHALADAEGAPARCEPLLTAVTEATRTLAAGTVRLLPQHVYDLARHAPGLAAPYELWAPLVEAGLRVVEQRDRLLDEVHSTQDDRDRARELAVHLEQELAHVDELIGLARFEVPDDDDDAVAAWRQLVARIHAGAVT
jgi:hypothetical protein